MNAVIERADTTGGGPSGLLSLLLLLALAALAIAWFRRLRRGRPVNERPQWGHDRGPEGTFSAAPPRLEEAVGDVDDQVRAFAAEVEALRAQVGGAPNAAADHARAVDALERAQTALDAARRPEDLRWVAEALEEGRWALASARARLAGAPPPERRAPCFFDPAHGPSARDVVWAPEGGAPRPVPACEADARRVESGAHPHAREYVIGGYRRPWWHAGPAYSPFYGGYFGGGLLPGLMLGSMLMPPVIMGGGWGDGFGDGDSDAGGDLGADIGGDLGGDFG